MTKKVICVIIGIVFIVSGIGKVGNTAGFSNLIAQYGFGQLQIFSPLIILIEILIGICLILCIKPKLMSCFAFILVFIFTIAFSYAHFKHGINDCGCFGALQIGKNSVITYIRNIILLALSLYIWLSTTNDNENISEQKKMLLLGIMLPMIFIAGFTFRLPPSFYSTKADKLINKNIKETFLTDYVKTSPDSSYLISVFSYNCPHCWNSIENYKAFKTSGMADSIVAFILVDTLNVNVESRNIFVQNFGDITHEIINTNEIQRFIQSVPTSFYIKNDTVKSVIKSELPSPFLFRNFIENAK